jgi:hypothetical protein
MNEPFMDEYLSALFLTHMNLEAFPTVKKELEEAKQAVLPAGFIKPDCALHLQARTCSLNK